MPLLFQFLLRDLPELCWEWAPDRDAIGQPNTHALFQMFRCDGHCADVPDTAVGRVIRILQWSVDDLSLAGIPVVVTRPESECYGLQSPIDLSRPPRCGHPHSPPTVMPEYRIVGWQHDVMFPTHPDIVDQHLTAAGESTTADDDVWFDHWQDVFVQRMMDEEVRVIQQLDLPDKLLPRPIRPEVFFGGFYEPCSEAYVGKCPIDGCESMLQLLLSPSGDLKGKRPLEPSGARHSGDNPVFLMNCPRHPLAWHWFADSGT